MTMQRIVPSAASNEWLADLIADAGAIPAAAFAPCDSAAPQRVDLSALPRQRSVISIPDAGVSLITSAEHSLAGYQR